MPRVRGMLGVAALLLVLAPGAAVAARCADGQWTIDDGPLTIGALEIRLVTLTQGVPALDAPCRVLRSALRSRHGGARLRALFACRAPLANAPPMRLRLRARIADGCMQMRGVFALQRRGVARFTAALRDATCDADAGCAPTSYCARPLGLCDAPGACEPRPDACIDLYLPVCGCDGTTYGNACDAAAQGVSIARLGECDACGGIAGVPCPNGQLCELPAGQCDGADLQGRCVDAPPDCPFDLYAPVCGCDGVTYGSDCDRRLAGVQKDHDGECEATTCAAPCDCYAALDSSFAEPCPLLCPNCGSYWACEKARCVERCGPLPPDVVACSAE